MNKIKVMFYADTFNGTSGYSLVVRELATRLAKNNNFEVYVQQIADISPAFIKDGVRVLPVFGQRGTNIFLSSIVNNIRLINPDIYIPICDSFLLVRDGLHKIQFSQNCLLMPYIPIDSEGIPDTSELILPQANKIFVMSEFGKKQLEEDGYENISVLYHGVDINKFKKISENNKNLLKQKFGIDKKNKVFLTIGRNFTRKRHMRLIEAIAIHETLFPNKNIKFYFHIADAESMPYNLKIFIDRMEKKYHVNIKDKIIFSKEHSLGNGIKEQELIEMYQMSDYYISATSGEGFGLTTIEAIASGLPVIIPDNSTAKELVGDRGWLVENEGKQNSGYGTQQPLVNIESLALTIENCLNSNNKDKIEKGLEFIKEQCNWDKITKKLENEIKNIRNGSTII